MANFCKHCGRPIIDGNPCPCTRQAPVQPPVAPMPPVNVAPVQTAQPKAGFWESFKNRIGLGDPEMNKTDAYEKGLNIIPDCVKANEGEVPIKQYNIATLRNRLFVIPYMKAVGRMQVTNKRVIFRAPGRCPAGRTTLQHEFAIDEIAGVEARREYVFNIWDLLFALITMAVGGAVMTAMIAAMYSEADDGRIGLAFFLSMLFGGGACVPFFVIKKKWLLKSLCLGGAFAPLLSNGFVVFEYGKYADDTFALFGGAMLILTGVVALLLALFCVFLHAIKPNLVLIIKTKSASDAIDITRKKIGLFGNKDEEHTGYTEVIPAEDAERCIREIDAMINDIQKLGDFGIEKWKA